MWLLVVFFSLTQDKFDIVPCSVRLSSCFFYLLTHHNLYPLKWKSWLRPWRLVVDKSLASRPSLYSILVASSFDTIAVSSWHVSDILMCMSLTLQANCSRGISAIPRFNCLTPKTFVNGLRSCKIWVYMPCSVGCRLNIIVMQHLQL